MQETGLCIEGLVLSCIAKSYLCWEVEVFKSPFKDWNMPELVCFSLLQTLRFPFHNPIQDNTCNSPSACRMGCKPESINCNVYMGDNLRVGPQNDAQAFELRKRDLQLTPSSLVQLSWIQRGQEPSITSAKLTIQNICDNQGSPSSKQ